VQAARKVLAEYVVKHPDAIAAISAKSPSGGSGSKSSSSTSAKTEAKDTKDAITVTAGVVPMPTAMGYYDAFLMAPAMGPAGLVPQMRSSAPAMGPTASPLASAPAATSAGLGSVTHGHGLHSAEAALRASPSAPATSISGSHGAVTHVSGSSSHSGSHSSGHSSSKSSSRSSSKSHR
jgi:hypothetical protein